ncbi:tRNA (adenosine(37)-N6)-dimethylallyltransferase MiaA [Candidatus Saccharibacteria bacterium]|nr:tRNA (adenosine(37)-N6)-dimethylallyltransferase MiaA [Candidatus Saccharibacteria bacterium]
MVPPQLVVIVGETASGKSALALEIAKKYNGEIICADSRTVYKGMDIGTAKPSTLERSEVKHHLLDILEPSEPFTAANFKNLANKAIVDIVSKGKLAIMVGGTGLYIDGVIFNYAFLPPVPTEERETLQKLSVAQLQEILKTEKIPLPLNKKNPRHLIRAIETNGAIAVKNGLRKNTIILGIRNNNQLLEDTIIQRTKTMFEHGLEREVQDLANKYGWDAPGMSAVGYHEWFTYFVRKNDLDQTKQLIQQHTLQYARRQRTWFRRNPHIAWVQNKQEAIQLVETFLQHK